MTWWLVLYIIGVIAAAIVVGLFISYVILRIQNRPWPFSRKLSPIKDDQQPERSSVLADNVNETAIGKTRQSAALLELENNLAIACGPLTNSPVKFQMNIWNTRRSEFDILGSALLGELTQAYVDMIRANNMVGMSTEFGQNAQNLTADYLKLSTKVAERLKRIMPSIREKLQ